MIYKKTISQSLPYIALLGVALLVIVGSIVAVKASTVLGGVTIENVETLNLTVEGTADNSLGAFISSGTNLTDLTIGNDLVVDGLTTLTGAQTFTGASTHTGAVTLSSSLSVASATTTVDVLTGMRENATSTNSSGLTLVKTESSKSIYIDGTGATYTLPAVAGSNGVILRFIVGSAFGTNAVIDSAEGDNIEGTLLVAGAVVDCDAEDQINFVADGENLGDYVELRSNGSKWYIGSSGALTSAKLTCTDPS